jgi:hypothetical protein
LQPPQSYQELQDHSVSLPKNVLDCQLDVSQRLQYDTPRCVQEFPNQSQWLLQELVRFPFIKEEGVEEPRQTPYSVPELLECSSRNTEGQFGFHLVTEQKLFQTPYNLQELLEHPLLCEQDQRLPLHLQRFPRPSPLMMPTVEQRSQQLPHCTSLRRDSVFEDLRFQTCDTPAGKLPSSY